MSAPAKPRALPYVRLALDLGPLVLFFATFEIWHLSSSKSTSQEAIYVATGVFMVAVLAALAIGYLREKKISPMPLFTAVLVIVFGGLTIYLKNDIFIKMKPTVLYTFFGALLLGGLAFNRLFIKYAFGQAFELREEGWRKLTWRWGFFAFALAIANEIIWHNFSTAVWVDFKVACFFLVFLFGLLQAPLVMKYEIAEDAKPDS